MTQRVSLTAADELLRRLDDFQQASRLALRVGDSPLYALSDDGYFTSPDAGPMFASIRTWLRPRSLELEAELCQILGDMLLDILDVTSNPGAAPDILTAPTLTAGAPRRVIVARLIQLREMLENLGPLHAAAVRVGRVSAAP